MAASIKRLRTGPERATDAKASQLRLLLTEAPDLLPERMLTQVIASLDQREPSTDDWRFILVSPEMNRAVIRWLSGNSRQPINAMQLWAEMLAHIRRDTGEVALTRDELAESVNVSSGEVSRIMGELETLGAISKQRVRVPGMRGPGVVRYFVNPRIATHQTGQARDKAQAKAPKLRLVSGKGA